MTNHRWRTIDIVIAAIIAVTFGVIFWAWGLLWGATEGAFAFFPPAQAVLYGIWLMPGVLAGLIIRKPGAALFAEFVAALISNLLGSKWGFATTLQGLCQGAAVELAFGLLLYRSWRLPAALLGGLFAGAAAAIFDFFVWNGLYGLWDFRVPYALITMLSSTIIAGAGSWALVRALAPTGVLDRFGAGRERALV